MRIKGLSSFGHLPFSGAKSLRVSQSVTVGEINGTVQRLELHVLSGTVKLVVRTTTGALRYAMFYPSGIVMEVAG